jgi:hypothetical protein
LKDDDDDDDDDDDEPLIALKTKFKREYVQEGAGIFQSARRLVYGLDDQAGASNFSLRHCVQTGSGALPAFLSNG